MLREGYLLLDTEYRRVLGADSLIKTMKMKMAKAHAQAKLKKGDGEVKLKRERESREMLID